MEPTNYGQDTCGQEGYTKMSAKNSIQYCKIQKVENGYIVDTDTLSGRVVSYTLSEALEQIRRKFES